MLSLSKRIKMSFEDVNRWLPEFGDADVLLRASRQYYTDVGDSGTFFTGWRSDEVERGGYGKVTEDHIRAPQSLFKIRYKYDIESLTDFKKFTDNFIKDRYTVRVTKDQNDLVKHKGGGEIPDVFIYDSITRYWHSDDERTGTFPLRDVFPDWYLKLIP
jgi:hypothetical protein